MYECRVERDSISPLGKRLTTFVITFPRVVLAETVTHRMDSDNWGDFEVSFCERTTTKDISKNSASSRAIPFPKMLERIKNDPYMPKWTLNQKGMQGNYSDSAVSDIANNIWENAKNQMISYANDLHDLGIHKQDCNRLLEPWAWVTQVVTSSSWDNFFALRCHNAAHPAFRHIARMMFLQRRKSKPTQLEYGQWHLPFVSLDVQNMFVWHPQSHMNEPLHDLIKFSAARCAWVSYENHEKEGTPDQMLRTFDRLVAEIPIHASPCEHQGTPLNPADKWAESNWRSNLVGWIQARKLIKYESIQNFNPSEEEISQWKEETQIS